MKTKKKRPSPQFATIFGRKFVGSFSPGWLFFFCSSSPQLSMGGRLNLDGGTLNLDGGTLTLGGRTRPPASPYNLSSDCTLAKYQRSRHLARRQRRIFSVFEISCHLPTCVPHTVEASHYTFLLLRKLHLPTAIHSSFIDTTTFCTVIL